MTMKIRIAAPCSARWDLMQGDERVRYCTECKLKVYNFSEMTSSEVEQLIAETEGRLCARFYRRADGTMLTRDCPNGFRAAAIQAARVASAAFAALMSVVPVVGQTSKDSAARKTPTMEAVDSSAVILVLDPQDAVIGGADVTLIDAADQKIYSARSDKDGKARFPELPSGSYDIKVMVTGFKVFQSKNISLPSAEVITARMAIGYIGSIEVTPVEPIRNIPADLPVSISMNRAAPLENEPYEATLNPRPRKRFLQKVAAAIGRIF